MAAVVIYNLDPELFCACRGERPVSTGVENGFIKFANVRANVRSFIIGRGLDLKC